MTELLIRTFDSHDQQVAQNIVSLGLGERWGHVDRSKNPDLFDIAVSYQSGCFLVGEILGEVVATGAYLPELELDHTVRIHRMSVLKQHRGAGYGKQILAALEALAHQAGYHAVVLETTESWLDAIRFYQSQGYQVTATVGGDTHFIKSLL